MNFGNNLIKLRKSKGWSQEDLANELDLSRQAISKWELGTTKPDIDNLMKISKLFSISIDELVNNEIVNSDAVSIEVKKKDKKHEIFVWIRRFIIVLAIIYAIDVIYKFSVLFTIAKAQEKYKNLNNYHYVITTYDNKGLKEKEECWFKDGVSKTVNTMLNENKTDEIITYIDYNSKTGYIKSKNSNSVTKVDTENINFLYNGEQLYSKLPIKIRNDKVSIILAQALRSLEVDIRFTKKEIALQINNNYINLERSSFKPIFLCYDKINNDSFMIKNYEIDLEF